MELVFTFISDILPIFAILTFIKAIIEYRRSQLWKESEFLAKEAKEFLSDESIKTVLTLLDWNARTVEIDGKPFKINDDYLIEALKTHNKKSRFTTEEAYCRDLFDNFFDKLSYFNIYIKTGLISEKKVYNYFGYYFDILIHVDRKPVEFIKTIDRYLNYYDYKNVIELLDGYKKNKKRP
jgi:hypothetical protein